MKIVKFLIVSVLLACVLLSVSYFAVAEVSWSAKINLDVTSPISHDNMFSVRVSVSDITSKDGIVCAIYHVRFDPTALELVSWTNSHPSEWDFSGKTSFGAEDWTDLLQDDNGNSYLMYTVMNTSLENGVKNDGVLCTDLVFKVRSSASKTTEITVTDISFMDKTLEDDCLLSDCKLEVSLVSEESSTVESSEDSSSAVSSEEPSKQPEESSKPAESSEREESSEAESSAPQESSEKEESSAIESSETESSADESEESADESEESSADRTEEPSDEETNTDETSEESVSESSADTAGSKAESHDEEPSKADNGGERVVMTVLVDNIKDEYGISALQFKLKYKPTLLSFVDYEIILPEDWDLNTEYTEDLCVVETNGDLMFCVMNYQVGCGVKEDGVLGFRIVFETKNVAFDPSLITMDDIMLINDDLKEVSSEGYHLSITYEGENGSSADDSFVSEQDEGKTLKIVIVVVSCVVLVAIALSAFVIIRKKKQS